MTSNNRDTILTTLFSSVYLFLTIFYYHIDKHITGIVFIFLTIIIPMSFIAIAAYVVKGIIELIKSRKNINLRICIPTIICTLTLGYTFFSPYKLDSENLESPVEIRACYEGTQNQATFKFREDKTFELNWTGVFGGNDWWTGKWNKNGDTLFLKWNIKRIEKLGDTLVIKNEYLYPVRYLNDSMKSYRPMFYLGYCRHEN
jgi:hypothetical protein